MITRTNICAAPSASTPPIAFIASRCLRVLDRSLFPRFAKRRIHGRAEAGRLACIPFITRWTKKPPGANLAKEEAQARAEAYLRDQKHVDLADWNLVETHTDKEARPEPITPSSGNRSGARFRRRRRRARTSACSCKCRAMKFPAIAFSSRFPKPGAMRKAAPPRRNSRSRSAWPRHCGCIDRRAGDFSPQPESSGNRAGSLAPRSGKLSLVMLLGGSRDLRQPNAAAARRITRPRCRSVTYTSILFISLIFVSAIYLAARCCCSGFAWFFLERSFGRDSIARLDEVRMPPIIATRFCIAAFGSAAVMGLNRLAALFARWPILRHSLGAERSGRTRCCLIPLQVALHRHRGRFRYSGFAWLGSGADCGVRAPGWMRAATPHICSRADDHERGDAGFVLPTLRFTWWLFAALWFGVTRIARFNVMGYFLLGRDDLH